MQANIDRITKQCEAYQATLIAVTKHQSVEKVDQYIGNNIFDIGENRIQEAHEKFPHLRFPYKKHAIGPIQSNKMRLAFDLFDTIHSIGNAKTYEKFCKLCRSSGKQKEIFFQINIAREPQKHGFSLEEFEDFCSTFSPIPEITSYGIMTMTPADAIDNERKEIFTMAKQLTEKYAHLGITQCSMGMSDDYELALDCGATHVRIGSRLFQD